MGSKIFGTNGYELNKFGVEKLGNLISSDV